MRFYPKRSAIASLLALYITLTLLIIHVCKTLINRQAPGEKGKRKRSLRAMCTWICSGRPNGSGRVHMNMEKLVSDKNEVIMNGKALARAWHHVRRSSIILCQLQLRF